jgi:hypothetical protein
VLSSSLPFQYFPTYPFACRLSTDRHSLFGLGADNLYCCSGVPGAALVLWEPPGECSNFFLSFSLIPCFGLTSRWFTYRWRVPQVCISFPVQPYPSGWQSIFNLLFFIAWYDYSCCLALALANSHSTNCSTLIIISHSGWYNRPNSGRRTKWTQSHPTPGFEPSTFHHSSIRTTTEQPETESSLLERPWLLHEATIIIDLEDFLLRGVSLGYSWQPTVSW